MRTPKLLVLDDGDALSEQVQRVADTLRPRPTIESCGSFDSVEEVLVERGPFEVLIAGPLVSKAAGFRRLRELRATVPDTQLLLVLDHWRSTDLRETVRAGAVDILRLPVTDDAMHEAIGQAMEAGAAAAARRAESGTVARPGAGAPGTVIAVVSASGGSGKTFLATNMAYHLQSQEGIDTCLIDLDLQFGELSTALRLRPRSTIYDLVAHNEDDDLGRRLEDHLERHESGIRLLAAPEDPAQADAIDPSDVAKVIDAARARFSYVVIDTPTALSESVLVALEHADQVFVLATLDLPSVRNLGVMLTTLKKLKVPPERTSLLLNKVEPDVGIDVARVEQYFPQGFSMIIPYGREVNRSLNMGQPVLAYAPRGEVSKALLAGLANAVITPPEEEPDENPDARRRRRLWSHRKSA